MDARRNAARTRRAAMVAAALALGAGALGGGSAGAFTQHDFPAVWDIAGVGPDAMSIDVFFNSGGCGGPGHGTAVETPESVTLTVVQTVSVPDGDHEACPAFYRRGTARIQLAAPLAGRAIRGRSVPPFWLSTPVGLNMQRVPQLVGFSSWEAKRALRRRGLTARIRYTLHTGQRTQVLGQAPPAGSLVAARGGTVRLRIGLR